MKTQDQLFEMYVSVRNMAKNEHSDIYPILSGLKEISESVKQHAEFCSIIERVKCKKLYESFDQVIEVIRLHGLMHPQAREFFGFEVKSYYDGQASVPEDVFREEKPAEKPFYSVEDILARGNVPTNPAKNDEIPEELFTAPVGKAEGEQQPLPVAPTVVAPEQPQAPLTPEQPESEVQPEQQGQEPQTEKPENGGFDPTCLDDFIGQEHVKRRLKEEIAVAKMQGRKHLDHILLFGNRGLGKSTLMKLIANELGVGFEFMDSSQMGNDVRSQRKMQSFLKNISERGLPVVIGFDEIHALPKHIQTGLLTLLNDRVYSYMDEAGVNHYLPIPEFTFVGATTDDFDVLPTIKDRCSYLTFYLHDYTHDELQQIFNNKFKAKGITADEKTVEECIKRCRSSIREVNAFVNGLYNKACLNHTTNATIDMAMSMFDDMGRDSIGLNAQDIKILKAMLDDPHGIMAADTLAAKTHIDVSTLTREFEPYLIKIGFIEIVPRGRSITERALKHLGVVRNEDGKLVVGKAYENGLKNDGTNGEN